jgi:hypothetical protein
MMPAVMRLRDAWLLLLLLWAPPASGQHGLPPAARPLHVRLQEADVVAIGTVERVETGRVDVAEAVVLRGGADDRFRLKRSPARPHGLAAGERVVLLLRGARTPYVLVDEPREIRRLPDAAEEARWRSALEALLAADDPAAQRDVYLAWIDGPDDELRQAASRALADRRSQPLPVPPELARERARIALDPARPQAVRRASAGVAGQHPAGTAALLAGLGDGVDPGVTQLALALGAMQRAEGFTPALVSALRSSDPAVVEAAIPAATLSASGPGVRAELERLAAHGATQKMRAAAGRALGRAEESAPGSAP